MKPPETPKLRPGQESGVHGEQTDRSQSTGDGRQEVVRRALRAAIEARAVEPVRVLPDQRDSRTPHRRRRSAAARMEPLPGLSARELRGRDPFAGRAHRLAVEVVGEGHSAYIVGVGRHVARDLALDAGLRTMFDPIRQAQALHRVDVDRFVDYALARGHTIVVRVDAGVGP